jgi:hypothetical protein
MDPLENLKEQRDVAARIIKAYDDTDGNGVDQDDAATLAELVTTMHRWRSKVGFDPYLTPEQQRLAAAAPDLLVALQACVDLLAEDESHMTPAEHTLIDNARAAIAKAKGQAACPTGWDKVEGDK